MAMIINDKNAVNCTSNSNRQYLEANLSVCNEESVQRSESEIRTFYTVCVLEEIT